MLIIVVINMIVHISCEEMWACAKSRHKLHGCPNLMDLWTVSDAHVNMQTSRGLLKSNQARMLLQVLYLNSAMDIRKKTWLITNPTHQNSVSHTQLM